MFKYIAVIPLVHPLRIEYGLGRVVSTLKG